MSGKIRRGTSPADSGAVAYPRPYVLRGAPGHFLRVGGTRVPRCSESGKIAQRSGLGGIVVGEDDLEGLPVDGACGLYGESSVSSIATVRPERLSSRKSGPLPGRYSLRRTRPSGKSSRPNLRSSSRSRRSRSSLPIGVRLGFPKSVSGSKDGTVSVLLAVKLTLLDLPSVRCSSAVFVPTTAMPGSRPSMCHFSSPRYGIISETSKVYCTPSHPKCTNNPSFPEKAAGELHLLGFCEVDPECRCERPLLGSSTPQQDLVRRAHFWVDRQENLQATPANQPIPDYSCYSSALSGCSGNETKCSKLPIR